MKLSLRAGNVGAAVMSAGVITISAVTVVAPPPLRDIRVPAIELSASAGPLFDAVADPADPGSDPAMDPLADAADSSLVNFLDTLATISIAAGVALTGLAATPYSLLSVAVTSLGTTIADLGGVFVPIGTAVASLSEVPARIGELITAVGTSVTQGIVTPIYDFLIKLAGGSAPDVLLSDGVPALDSGDLPPDLAAVF